jgi:hypothetical protein
MALLKEDEETEKFIEDYISQIKLMASMSDLQVKVLLRQLMIEDPEWFGLLRQRYRRKQLAQMKSLMKEVTTDLKGSIHDLARKVA